MEATSTFASREGVKLPDGHADQQKKRDDDRDKRSVFHIHLRKGGIVSVPVKVHWVPDWIVSVVMAWAEARCLPPGAGQMYARILSHGHHGACTPRAVFFYGVWRSTMDDKLNRLEARRRFLATCGKFAVITPPAVTVLLSSTAQNYAVAGSGRGGSLPKQGNNGWGNGGFDGVPGKSGSSPGPQTPSKVADQQR
jgi:hypothetical protein